MEATVSLEKIKTQEEKLAQFLKPFFSQHNSRRTALQYTTGLLSKTERKNSWQLAEEAGLQDPYAFQYLLSRAWWSADALRDHLQTSGIQEKGEGILIVDETGFLKKGKQSAGVARQYSGTAGRIENCQIGVFLAYSTDKHQLLIDRELYIPQDWFKDRERCKKAGIPEEVVFKTKPELAQVMLERAFANGIKPAYVVGDQVYGNGKLRMYLEQKECAYVLGTPSNHQVYIDTQVYQASELVDKFDSWQRISAGKGSKGERYYEWKKIGINGLNPEGWRHWLLLRRNIKEREQVSYYIVFAREETSLEELAKAAGSRWVIETCFARSKGEVGLDHYEVRNYVGWYRHITLCLVALLFLEDMRKALAEEEEVVKKKEKSSMQSFLNKRGLG